tara:strand:- start:1654 stop:1899 length:246 start_codon:yes stop_codon:yes gene_type:complete
MCQCYGFIKNDHLINDNTNEELEFVNVENIENIENIDFGLVEHYIELQKMNDEQGFMHVLNVTVCLVLFYTFMLRMINMFI